MTYRSIRTKLEQGPGYDPGNPFDASAEMFRKSVCDIALEAIGKPPMDRLEPHQQIEAIVAGILTGMIGVCFAHIEPKGHPTIMKFIREYLPQARVSAEEMMPDHDGERSDTERS